MFAMLCRWKTTEGKEVLCVLGMDNREGRRDSSTRYALDVKKQSWEGTSEEPATSHNPARSMLLYLSADQNLWNCSGLLACSRYGKERETPSEYHFMPGSTPGYSCVRAAPTSLLAPI